MRPDGFAAPSPPLHQYLPLRQRVKDPGIQKFIPQHPLKGVLIPIFPRRFRLNVERLDSNRPSHSLTILAVNSGPRSLSRMRAPESHKVPACSGRTRVGVSRIQNRQDRPPDRLGEPMPDRDNTRQVGTRSNRRRCILGCTGVERFQFRRVPLVAPVACTLGMPGPSGGPI